MTILGDVDIRRAMLHEGLRIEPFDDAWIQPNAVDLPMSPHVKFAVHPTDALGPVVVDVAHPQKAGELFVPYTLDPDECLLLGPGKFVLASTVCKLSLPPTIMGVMMGRSSLGRLGLLVHHTAGHIDAGFEGHITMELSCQAPWILSIPVGFRIASLVLMRLESRAAVPYGDKPGAKYHGQMEAPEPARNEPVYRSKHSAST